MHEPIRFLITLSLSGLLALGGMPAWAHHADCGRLGHCCSSSAATAHKVADATDQNPPEKRCGKVCTHGCSHHEENEASAKKTPIGTKPALTASAGPTGPGHQHGSGSCVLCQSLQTPGGAITPGLASAPHGLACQSAYLIVEVDEASDSRPRPLSRGPPKA
ncbi:MAG: hypothetical protein AAGD07_06020 [Planctomycetota bacterium]